MATGRMLASKEILILSIIRILTVTLFAAGGTTLSHGVIAKMATNFLSKRIISTGVSGHRVLLFAPHGQMGTIRMLAWKDLLVLNIMKIQTVSMFAIGRTTINPGVGARKVTNSPKKGSRKAGVRDAHVLLFAPHQLEEKDGLLG